MTALLDPPGAATATGPTARTVLRQARGPVLVAVAVVLAALAVTLAVVRGRGGTLDPRSYSPSGSHALARLLADRGVPVRVAGTLPEVHAGGPRTTVVLPFPDRLTDAELARLAGSPAGLVVVAAGQDQVDALRLPVSAGRSGSPAEVREPACTLPAATRAGTVLLGGTGYTPRGPVPAVACYAGSGRAALLGLPGGRVLLGSGALLTNEHLAEQGDAALALGLLGGGDEVVWLLPVAGRPGGAAATRTPLSRLLPEGFDDAVGALAAAVVLLGLWRARRLGRVVPEPLPVVVRAAETVEGLSRLYRAAGARDAAAASLRAAARDRLAARLGLGPSSAAPHLGSGSGGDAALVGAVAGRTGLPPAEVTGLLYGPAPADDPALVRLADDLRALASSTETETAG